MSKYKPAANGAPSATSIAYANTVVKALDVLLKKREKWEAKEFKAANDALYDLLADCLRTYSEQFVLAVPNDRKALRLELTRRLTESGVKVQNNTKTLTMVVRYVFCSDRKRAHSYTTVLLAAMSHEINADDLPAWIVASGGVEEIKRKVKMSAETLANREKITAAKVLVKSKVDEAKVNPIARVHLDQVVGEKGVLLVKGNPDGSVDIIGVLTEANDALFNTISTYIAKSHVKSGAMDEQINAELNALKDAA